MEQANSRGIEVKRLIACFLIVTAPLVFATDAGDTSDYPKAVHCIDLQRIKSSEILDDSHMLFKMANGDMYLNTLEHRCPGLRRSQPYMVRTSLTRLCNLDIITLLDATGFGFMPGASCGLSMFEPVTKAQVDAVKAAIKAERD